MTTITAIQTMQWNKQTSEIGLKLCTSELTLGKQKPCTNGLWRHEGTNSKKMALQTRKGPSNEDKRQDSIMNPANKLNNKITAASYSVHETQQRISTPSTHYGSERG